MANVLSKFMIEGKEDGSENRKEKMKRWEWTRDKKGHRIRENKGIKFPSSVFKFLKY